MTDQDLLDLLNILEELIISIQETSGLGDLNKALRMTRGMKVGIELRQPKPEKDTAHDYDLSSCDQEPRTSN